MDPDQPAWNNLKLCVIVIAALAMAAIYNVHLSLKVSHLERSLQEISKEVQATMDNQLPNRNSLPSRVSRGREFFPVPDPFLLSMFQEVEEEGKVRIRRKSSFKIYGCHLLAAEDRRENSAFLWSRNNTKLSTCEMATLPSSGRDSIEYIKITQSGYYLVYTQLTFFENGLSTIGFTTMKVDVKKRFFGYSSSDRGTALLTTVMKQASNNSQERVKDSGYHSGLFYLAKGEALKVIPMHTTVSKFDLRPEYSYFGAILLSKSVAARP